MGQLVSLDGIYIKILGKFVMLVVKSLGTY